MKYHESRISRAKAASLGQETIEILRRRGYRTPAGRRVDLSGELAEAVAGTRSYAPGDEPPLPSAGRLETRVTVRNQTTLVAAHELREEDLDPGALNFASATHPGGGFTSGALAQEEYLARSSGLYACLEGNPMYADHRQRRDPLYRDWVIYSPRVPVFRRDDGQLLDRPWPLAVLTSPAPNANALDRRRHGEIAPALRTRIQKVLACGLAHGHDSIVLGAWGCGAFGCDPVQVADLFAEALGGPFAGCYEAVRFAVLDLTRDERILRPFERALGG